MKRTITLQSRITAASVRSAIRFPSAAGRAATVVIAAVTATGSAGPYKHRLER